MLKVKLKELREKNKLSQQDVAQKLNISPQSISKWERGEALPSVEYLPTIAKIYNCSINYLFGQEDKLVYIENSTKNTAIQEEYEEYKCIDKIYIDIKNALENNSQTLPQSFFIENQDKLPLLKTIIKWLETQKKCSISRLQRGLHIGYARAASIQDGFAYIGLVNRSKTSFENMVIEEQVKKVKQLIFC